MQTAAATTATLAVNGDPISNIIALTRGGSLIIAGTNDDIFVQQGREPGTTRVIVRTEGSPISLETFRTRDISRFFIFGRVGNDRLINLTSIAVSMWGGRGDDFLFGNQGRSILVAGAGNDLVVAGAGNDYVDAGDGQDMIFGGSGADRLFGGTGQDTLVGEGGRDIVLGQAGLDRILDGTGHDESDAGYHEHSLVGGDGKAILAGEAANANLFSGLAVNDTLYGESGDDTFSDDDNATNVTNLDDKERWRFGRGRV